MSLENVFYVSQTVASVAVVGSLIFVGMQVRGSERAQRAIMQQGRADRTSAASLSVANANLARIWRIGVSGEDLTRDEFAQWMMLARSSFLSGEDSFMQYQAGQLDRRAFDSYVAGAAFYMASPGMRAAWKVSSGQFGADFRAFGDSIVARTTVKPGPDIYDEWRAEVASERASAAAQPIGRSPEGHFEAPEA